MKLNLDVLFHSVSLCVVFKVPNWWQVINSKLLRNFSIEWFSHSYCFATSQSNNQLILVASQLLNWMIHSFLLLYNFSFIWQLSLSNGDNEIRTRDLLLARQALSQLSYTPRESSSHLLSRTVSSKVPSAAYVLTIVFEMRTGVSHKRIATRISLFNFVLFRTLITEQYLSLLILP